jgi:transglutaminase-like putative cysteine protease
MRKTIGATAVLLLLGLTAVSLLWWRTRLSSETTTVHSSSTSPSVGLQQQTASSSTPVEPGTLLATALGVYNETKAQQYDLDPLAQTLAPGIDRAFAFVRDRIRYEAYPGTLRGAEGALAARAANSYDRSLLLARLLATQGIATRFAIGTLPSDRAEELFSRIFVNPAPIGQPSAQVSAPGADVFWKRVVARGDRDYRALASAVHFAPAPSTHEAILKTITRHVWVQANVNGEWTDLDTAFADGAPGKTYCDAEDTVEEMPDEWNQAVTVRVIAERLAAGELTRTTLLEARHPATELVDREIFLTHTPDSPGGGLLQTPGSSDAWRPVLIIDGDQQVGDPFTFSDASDASSFAGALAGGGGDDTSVFVAEWLEFEIQEPDGGDIVTRRTLVDRAGEAWRASSVHDPSVLRPLPMAGDVPVAAQGLHNIWITAGSHNLARAARETLALLLPAPAGVAPAADADEALHFLALRNLSTLIWSDQVAIPGLNDVPDIHLYIGTPRITVVSEYPGAGGTATLTQVYDLRREVLAGAARDAAGEAVLRDRRIRFGAMEGALEHEASASDFAMAGASLRLVSTSGLLTSAGVIAIAPTDAPRVDAMTTDPEKRARIALALHDGDVLVAPRQSLTAGPAAWWELAPDGTTRAVLGPDINAVIGTAPLPGNSAGGTSPLPNLGGRSWDLPPDTPTPSPGRDLTQIGRELGKEEEAIEQSKKNKRGGNEYITVVLGVSLAAVFAATIYAAVKEYHFQMAMRQFEAAHAAAAAARGW